MKNNKKIQYILLPIVILIWGLVVYRIFFEGKTKPENLKQVIKPIIKESEEKKEETYKLFANYRDPFLTEIKANSESVVSEEEKKKAEDKSTSNLRRRRSNVSRMRWPEVKYNGFIESKNNKYTILLKVKDRDYLAYTGDTIENIYIKDFYKDSLLIVYKSEEKTLMK